MMHHLDSDDIRLVDEILSQHLRGLVREIASTDDRDFRTELRQRYERIEALRARLVGRPLASAEAPLAIGLEH